MRFHWQVCNYVFIHVYMDKRVQAIEKIQAQVLEFFCSLNSNSHLLFFYHFQMHLCAYYRHPCKHSNGTGLCKPGWAKVQSSLTQWLKLHKNQWKKNSAMPAYNFPSLNSTVLIVSAFVFKKMIFTVSGGCKKKTCESTELLISLHS